MKHKKKVVKPVVADDLQASSPSNTSELPSYAPSYHSDDEEPLPLAISLPRKFERAFEKAVKFMKWIPVPERPVPPTKPAKQVLGLPCPRKWNGMQEQPRGVHKTMPGYKGKGKEAKE
jgi:hypothetical protein